MEWRDVVPWSAGRKAVPVRRTGNNAPFFNWPGEMSEMGRVFDQFLGDSFLAPFEKQLASSFSPSVDVSENEKEWTVTVEVPGMTEENVNLTLDDDQLVIEGEKSDKKERTEGKVHYVESQFGKFRRVLPLPQFVDVDNIQASTKNGVLTVQLPKLPEASNKQRTISVKTEG